MHEAIVVSFPLFSRKNPFFSHKKNSNLKRKVKMNQCKVFQISKIQFPDPDKDGVHRSLDQSKCSPAQGIINYWLSHRSPHVSIIFPHFTSLFCIQKKKIWFVQKLTKFSIYFSKKHGDFSSDLGRYNKEKMVKMSSEVLVGAACLEHFRRNSSWEKEWVDRRKRVTFPSRILNLKHWKREDFADPWECDLR